MRFEWRRTAVVAWAVWGLAACDASIERGDDRSRVTLEDAGPEAARGDAGANGCAGTSEPGACEGGRARWCEAGAVREQDCASSGQVCEVTSGRARCSGAPQDECGNPIEQEQLRITNAERARAGLAPFVCDPGLTRAARAHSQDMCDQGYFDHDSQDGRTFRDRIDAEGVRWSRIGENIARGQATPQSVHEAWMGSSGHRANILGRFGRIGIGHVACGGQGPYWTQDFAD